MELDERLRVGERIRRKLSAIPEGVAPHRWAAEPGGERVVLWGMCRLIDVEQLPDRRMVVRFDLSDGHWRRLWIVAQRPEAEVCARDPGFDDDLVVRASSRSLASWHMGRTSLGHAMHAGTIRVDGPRAAIGVLARWGGVGPFARIEPATRRTATA